MSVRARYLTLLALRWFATGLVIPVSLLLPLSRGLSVTEVATAMAAQGVVVLLLEVPSGVLSDAWGRRPVVLLAAAFAAASYAATLVAESVLSFAVAWALAGVFRALDSGPLEAWYVDAKHAAGAASEVPSSLALGGAVVSGAVASGSLGAAAIVHLAPWSASASLAVPYGVALAVVLAQGLAASVLMTDDDRRSARTPWRGALAGGWGMLRASALRGLIVVVVLHAVGVAALELLMPVRLEEMAIDESAAATTQGLVSAGAWVFAAVGAIVSARLLRRYPVMLVAVVLIGTQSAALMVMGLAVGPLVLVAGFWLAYLVHSAYGAAFNALVHARVDGGHRATALSMTSMAFLGTAAAAGVGLGALSDAATPSTSLLVGAASLAAAAIVLAVLGRPCRGAPFAGERITVASRPR